jgi:hypothetical protein
MSKRFFYALVAEFTGVSAVEYQRGFANTKIAVAFRCKQDREDFLDMTRDLSAKTITRREAKKLTTDCSHLFAGTFVPFWEHEHGVVEGIEILERYWVNDVAEHPSMVWALANEAKVSGLKAVQ